MTSSIFSSRFLDGCGSNSASLFQCFFPPRNFAGEGLVPAGQPSLLLDLRELVVHIGVVSLAHDPLGHAEQDVVLFEDVLPQERDVLLGGIGVLSSIEGLRLARISHASHAVPTQNMLVKHDANWPALFGDASLLQDREENVLFLGVVALVGKLLKEPGC